MSQRDRADQATKDAVTQRDRADQATKDALMQLHRAAQAEHSADKAKIEAQANADQAKASADQANANLREAQTTQSRFLADLARERRTADADAVTAALLALEALPDAVAGTARPYVPEAELQLDGAWRDLRERLVLGHDDAVSRRGVQPRRPAHRHRV